MLCSLSCCDTHCSIFVFRRAIIAHFLCRVSLQLASSEHFILLSSFHVTPLLVVTHLHLRVFVHWRVLIVTFFARPLHTLRARRILCARRRRETRRRDSRRRNTSSHTRRSTKAGRRRKGVCGKSLLLRLAGLERRVVLAGHFREGVALFFGVADFLFACCQYLVPLEAVCLVLATHHFSAVELEALTCAHCLRRGVHVSEQHVCLTAHFARFDGGDVEDWAEG